MIETIEIVKSFENVKAVDGISLQIKENSVFGLVGTNGAGKSTFMRLLCGILVPDKGEIRIEDKNIFENVNVKQEVFYLSDEQYFFTNATAVDMAKYYEILFPKFSSKRLYKLLDQFDLDKKRKIHTFSKGMKKQLGILMGIASGCKYLLCDETFDGLDPLMRQAVKSIIAGELEEREFTPVIASHNLRELEDICDYVGVLHRGGVVLNKDLEYMKSNIHKIQCVFKDEASEKKILDKFEIVKQEKRGSLQLLTVRGNREVILNTLQTVDPIFSEVLPLTLEEIFISETEAIGYDIKKLIG